MANDKYRSFQDLAANEKLGVDYDFESRSKLASGVVVIAPHGGRIEPNTDVIADAIAGGDFSFYRFRALKEKSGLHIRSHLFNEPTCVQLVAAHQKVVSIHGWGADGVRVCVGGRDTEMIEAFKKALATQKIELEYAPISLRALDPQNITNRGANGRGVQFELTMDFRKSVPMVRTFSAAIRSYRQISCTAG